MPNTLLTPAIIAKEAIMVLQNTMVMAGLVHRDFSDEFAQVGDTITVRKPATFVANEYNGSTISVQEAAESSVSVKMDKLIDVSFSVTSKDMALNVQDFSKQFIEPAMRAHAQKLDELLAALYVDVPYIQAVSGTPAISDIAGITAVMNTNKVPLAERKMVVDPTTYSKYVVLDSILGLDKSGSTAALREASMGRVLGLDSFMDQNIVAHTKGTLDAGAAGTALIGATTVTVASGGNAKTVKKGDIVTFADTPGTYVCTELLTTGVDGSGSLKIYPGLAAAVSAKTITVKANHTANLAFHKNAFAMVTRPLAAPAGAAKAETISFNGVSCRVVYDYDINTKTDTISIDFLAGFKTLTPELAVRFLG